jgi:NAD(P)H-hydrate epimerase
MNRFYLKKHLPKYLTSEDMAVIDENATSLGIPRQVLMENAGAEVARIINENHEAEGKKIAIISGIGNNGGDSYVTARHLLNLGATGGSLMISEPRRRRRTGKCYQI